MEGAAILIAWPSPIYPIANARKRSPGSMKPCATTLLIALVRNPISGALIRLIGSNWRDAAFWRDIILGGNVRAQPGEDMALYEGWSVMLERSEFERWCLTKAPPTDRTRKGFSTSKRADEAMREVLRRLRNDAKAAGKKVPNTNQAFPVVQSIVLHEFELSVSRADFRLIANEDEFTASRLKAGERFRK
jgi:hypothetical protein